jgi:hypothetical protein
MAGVFLCLWSLNFVKPGNAINIYIAACSVSTASRFPRQAHSSHVDERFVNRLLELNETTRILA